MSGTTDNPESRSNLWAPWRMEYIDSLSDKQAGCFLCENRDDPDRDAEHLVVWRGPETFAILNRFPYTGGHCLVAPYAHVGELADLETAVLTELMEMVRDLQLAITRAIRPEGFNIGINLGHCAGAGLPGHLHMHIVPRWAGDTNFMPVLGDVHVVPEFLSKTRLKILQAAEELSLPKLTAAAGG
ncbi:MAG: HIT domain-containing protein [Phycisphaerae bacterium]|nr:HIT domain-containing protein [Phycisphaerae bacterium]